MSIKDTLIDAGIVVVVVSLSFSIGMARGYKSAHASDQAAIAAARADTVTAVGNLSAANQALNDIKHRLDQQLQDLHAQQAKTSSLMAERDALQTQLAREAANHHASDRKAAHEDDACSNLDYLPICPALSHRLFGTPAPDTAAGRSAGRGDRPGTDL